MWFPVVATAVRRAENSQIFLAAEEQKKRLELAFLHCFFPDLVQ